MYIGKFSSDTEFLAACESIGKKYRDNPAQKPLTDEELKARGAVDTIPNNPDDGDVVVFIGHRSPKN